MASIFARCKHLTFSFILLSIALILLATNHLYFIINYSRQLQDEFQEVATYYKSFKNPDWLKVVSRGIIDERLKIELVNVDRVQKDIPIRAMRNASLYLKRARNPMWFEVVSREFKVARINIGLVNIDRTMDEVQAQAKMIEVQFDRVREDIRWSDLSPEWMDGNSTCPDIPMPRFGDYHDLDVIVARVPRSVHDEGGVLRDVFRLQVNLVVANLLVRSGRKGSGTFLAVFLGSLEPMWEIFRCDDVLWNVGNTWVYKPELERIKQLVVMPVGACQFVPPLSDFGDQEKWRMQSDDGHLPQPKEAYVTVLHTSEDYVCGAIVLAQSLKQSNTTKDLILLADSSISPESMEGLRSAGWKMETIERIRSPYSRKDTYNEWNYSKLRIWQLKQYEKVMFIDADLVVIRNLDGFFAYPQLSAAGNYHKHFFNSGLMMVEPSQCTFDTLMKKMMVVESYNGGDQGFLNEMFAWWHRLPHELNFMKVFVDKNDSDRSIERGAYALHYTGLKPWKCSDEARDCNWDMPEFHRYASDSAHRVWWRVYRAMPEKLRSYCLKNRYRPESGASPEDHSVVGKSL